NSLARGIHRVEVFVFERLALQLFIQRERAPDCEPGHRDQKDPGPRLQAQASTLSAPAPSFDPLRSSACEPLLVGKKSQRAFVRMPCWRISARAVEPASPILRSAPHAAAAHLAISAADLVLSYRAATFASVTWCLTV